MIPFMSMQNAFLIIFNALPLPIKSFIVTIFMIMAIWFILKFILGVI